MVNRGRSRVIHSEVTVIFQGRDFDELDKGGRDGLILIPHMNTIQSCEFKQFTPVFTLFFFFCFQDYSHQDIDKL